MLLATSLLAASVFSTPQAPQGTTVTGTARAPSAAALAAFVENRGQWHPAVLHAASFGGMHVFLEHAGFTVDVRQVDRVDDVPAQPTGVRGVAVRFGFGTPHAVVAGAELAGRYNFLVGRDRDRWVADARAHDAVHYQGIAPGIELVAYQKAGHFEYDLVVGAGADLDRAVFTVAGADGLALRDDGALEIATALGTIVQSAPVAFVGAGAEPIACRCELRGADRFVFVAPGWNGREVLRVDPGLTYGSYFGGADKDAAGGVHIGDDGVVTTSGSSKSLDFPVTVGAYQTVPVDEVVTLVRLDPSQPPASQVLVATFFGGSGRESNTALHVDELGVATVLGTSRSSDLPTTPNAFGPTFGGVQDVLLARFDLSQSGAQQLLYSTYVGGGGNEFASNSMIVEGGVVTFTGSTLSTDYPTTADAWSQAHAGGGGTDSILTRIDTSLQDAAQLVYSSYFGGPGGDGGTAVALDPAGRVVVCGTSSSAAFPVTADAYANALSGPGDVAFAVFDLTAAPANQIVYATYFGGSGGDNAVSMQVDDGGAIVFCGLTNSADFPVTAGAFDTSYDGQEAYCARLHPALPPASQLLYATFVGGTAAESATWLRVDAAGVITMSGGTTSTDFPITPGAFQSVAGGGFNDPWVVRLDPARPAAQQLLYSTLLCGNGLEALFAFDVDALGGVWAVGYTQSTDFPTTGNGYDTAPNGGNDVFLAHLDMLPTGVTAFGASSPGCDGPLVASVTSMPSLGNADFSLTCTNITAPALGVIVIGTQPAVLPIAVLGVDLWVDPGALQVVGMVATSPGIDFPVLIGSDPALVGATLDAQFGWFSSAAGGNCPVAGWAASNALQFTVQP